MQYKTIGKSAKIPKLKKPKASVKSKRAVVGPAGGRKAPIGGRKRGYKGFSG